MTAPAVMDMGTLQDLVTSLSSQVERLKRELGDLHGTDTVALRRAYGSMGQHITALQQESKSVEANIRNLQEELLTSSDLAQAIVETGTVAAASYAATRAVKATPLQNLRNASALCDGIWVCGALYLGLRFVTGICHKAWASGYTNPRLKWKLVSDWQLLQERIQIMSELLDSGPYSSEAWQHQQLPDPGPSQLPSAPAWLPAASEPPPD